MANVSRPFGLRPVRYLNGTPWNGSARPYYVPASYATALYIGDPVQVTGDSNSTEYNGFVPGALPIVNIATAGATNDWIGAIVSVLPVTRESTIYRAASTEAIVFVADDPNLIFRVQDDGAGSPATGTVFSNANLTAGGGGSTVTGRSSWQIDGTSFATAQPTYQVAILAASPSITNDVTTDFCVWEVRNNQWSLGNAAAPGV